MSAALPSQTIARLDGYGLSASADSYLFRPTRIEEIADAFELARKAGRKVVLRGAGRSYGDASILGEAVAVDISRLNQVLNWNKATGIMEAQGGVTIEQIWRYSLEDGWWPPVVSGTMYPTLAGALGMNIHGKNNPQAGTLGEHVEEIDVVFPNGELKTITRAEPLFRAVISGFGMFGAIVRVRLKLKKIHSGDLHVLPLSCANWDEHFEAFERYVPEADYQVSWIDCFGAGRASGRGQFHAAWYADEPGDTLISLRAEHQDLPDTVMGLVPKSMMWRALKLFNNRTGMRFVNAARHNASKYKGSGRPHDQSLVGFSFLLDYVPNWRNAYLPGGFIQYQSFVPKESAPRVFARQVELQQEAGLESFLGVLKRNRPDEFLFSHAVDGYSLALDFKLTRANRDRLFALAHRMNDLVLDAGGRFYMAKDSTLRPSDVRTYLGENVMNEYRSIKDALDPNHLLESGLARRLGFCTD
jgi:decaprenylphospho-beta-D-ribofuranose 2-oxidase